MSTSPTAVSYLDANNLLADAPQGVLDELFPPNEFTPQTTETQPGTTSAPTQSQTPAAQPQTQTQPDYFLKAGDTVYKSVDEAVRGITHKDAIISDLRQKWIAEKGVDPITGQPVVKPAPIAEPTNYLDNKAVVFDKLVEAAQRAASGSSADKAAYVDLILGLQREQMQREVVEPYGPTIVSFAQQQALNQVTSEIPDFPAFQKSVAYQEVLDSLPELKQAISVAENDTRFSQSLPGLYKTSYWANLGRRSGEIARTAAATATAASNTKPASTRPTTTPTTMTPTPGGKQAEFTLATPEGRRAIIEAFESRGLHERSMDEFSRR